jgi:L-histidine N-alpha-methyltransferase
MRTASAAPVTIRRLSPPHDLTAELASDVGIGMRSTPKAIPSKYFYDARGSELFDEITRLPEYYLTRTETAILEAHAGEILDRIAPDELIELGSGSSEKTRLLLDAMLERAPGRCYVPIDISEAALASAVQALCDDYADLAIDGLVGDYDSDLGRVPRRGRRLVTFLGSTIGNFGAAERVAFFRSVANMLEPGDRFLLGVDLVKDVETMVAAYNDSAGVTADFTRNILTIINRELGADFDPNAFVHRPVWNSSASRMEAWLEASKPMDVSIADLEMRVRLSPGERIRTEVSCKFTRDGLASELACAGLAIEHWYTDERGWFGLPLVRPGGQARGEAGDPAPPRQR